MAPDARAWPSVSGFFGKLPARGDFVRSGLPGSFIDPWDEWISRMLAATQSSLGAGWRDAWVQAPIWRFALDPGICGPDGAVGLWMPSIDRAGRYYPLTIAAVSRADQARTLAGCAGAFLSTAESAGLDALEHDLTPDALTERLAAANPAKIEPVPAAEALVGASLWWTDGAPLVPPTAYGGAALPTEERFSRMIDAGGAEMVG